MFPIFSGQFRNAVADARGKGPGWGSRPNNGTATGSVFQDINTGNTSHYGARPGAGSGSFTHGSGVSGMSPVMTMASNGPMGHQTRPPDYSPISPNYTRPVKPSAGPIGPPEERKYYTDYSQVFNPPGNPADTRFGRAIGLPGSSMSPGPGPSYHPITEKYPTRPVEPGGHPALMAALQNSLMGRRYTMPGSPGLDY